MHEASSKIVLKCFKDDLKDDKLDIILILTKRKELLHENV